MFSFDCFDYRNNELFCEDVRVKEIVEKVGTPAYVYSKNTTGKKENKFGIDFDSAGRLIKDIDSYKNIDLKGIHVHLGSPIYSPDPYVQGLEKVYKFLQESLDKKERQRIEYINIGGGYCISYTGE